MVFNQIKSLKPKNIREKSKKDLIILFKRPDQSFKYPHPKRNTKKKENQNSDSQPKIKLKIQNLIKNFHINQILFVMNIRMKKTAIFNLFVKR